MCTPLSTSGSSKFTTLSSFEYRRVSFVLPSRDEPRSASSLIGPSAALQRSAHAQMATKTTDPPPERLRSGPYFRNKGNPFHLPDGPCHSETGEKFPGTPGIQSSRNPLQWRSADISRSTRAKAQQQAAAPIAPAGGGMSSSLAIQHCRVPLERSRRQQPRKRFYLRKAKHSWQSLEFAGSREDGCLGECAMQGIARLVNFVQGLGGMSSAAWCYSPEMPEIECLSALSSGS